MEYEGEGWVQRLRDGVVPPRTALMVTATALLVAGAVLSALELAQPEVVRVLGDSRGGFVLLLVPPALVVAGPVLAVAAVLAGRQDRRLVARVRQRSVPSFFVPVASTTLVAADTFPRPRPLLWTADDDGLHAWAPGREDPVRDVPWPSVGGIDAATVWTRGRRQDYGIWVALRDGGHVVLAPRSALGSPVGASTYRRDVIMRILRSLRGTQDPGGKATADVS